MGEWYLLWHLFDNASIHCQSNCDSAFDVLLLPGYLSSRTAVHIAAATSLCPCCLTESLIVFCETLDPFDIVSTERKLQ